MKKKKVLILGSTGSIGRSTLNVIEKNKKHFNILGLSTNKNIYKILRQANKYNVKNLIIYNKKSFLKLKKLTINKSIKVFNNFETFIKKNKFKIDYTIIGISGFHGLDPTIKVIPHTKNLSSANKESIICGWKFINSQLKKYKTNFIPIDSEHFSIWSLIQNGNKDEISKIYLTASGGPFLKKKIKDIKNVSIKDVINHPNWRMGPKISTDSATMMNKIFELIEASKLFNIDINKFEIIIHPKSYIHAIVVYNNGLCKIIAHDTSMEIPIFNSFFNNSKIKYYGQNDLKFKLLNGINFLQPKVKNFPYLNLLKLLKSDDRYFEVMLVLINDFLVKKFLKNEISFIRMQNILFKLLSNSFLKKFYNKKLNTIKELNLFKNKVNKYLIELNL